MSNNKNVPTNHNTTSTPALHESGLKAGSLIESAVRHLNSEQTQNLMAEAAKEALRLEVKKTEQLMDYVEGKKAAEDHIDTFKMLDKSGRTTRQVVSSTIKTGAGDMRIESKSGATCFVASAAYQDPNHVDVIYLRAYRDQVLAKNYFGRKFISTYWIVGPYLAKVVRMSNYIQKCSKFMISTLVDILKKRFDLS